MKKLAVILLLFPLLMVGQSKNQNYTKSRIYKAPSTGTIAANDTIVNVSYFDGLGRTSQTVAARAGGSGQDIVTPVMYDALGRQSNNYLPYVNPTATAANSSLNYRDNGALITSINSYYNQQFPENIPSSVPYGVTQRESSPLQRVTEQSFPGHTWAVGGKTLKFAYETNSATVLPVYEFGVRFNNTQTNNPTIFLPGVTWTGNQYYPAGTLYKNVTKNENWRPSDGNNNTVHEYKDFDGRLILNRKFNEGVAHDTYYVYDDYGNLTFVIPPEAFANPAFIVSGNDALFNQIFIINQSILEKYSYIYKYDARNRVIEKQTPGKGVEFTVYDKLNRPVLTQSANQRAAGKWSFVKYDKFSRVAYSGEYSSTATRVSLQATLDAAVTLSETKTTTAISHNGASLYYTNAAFPSSSINILTINYYDNYTFAMPNITVPASTAYNESLTASIKTLPTGTVVRILDAATPNLWVTSVLGYDAKGRVIWSKSNDPYYNTTNTLNVKLNFLGNTTATTKVHTRTGTTSENIKVSDGYTYDYMGRELYHTQLVQLGTDNMIRPVQIISSKKYNERGQLIEKGIGGTNLFGALTNNIQTINYSYNIRGWLTKINDPLNLGTDLFAESINYDSPTTGTPLYNGNISQVFWKTVNDNQLRRYDYTYDALNRIKTANYTNSNNANLLHNASYDLNSIDYDRNGNITFMERQGNRIGTTLQSPSTDKMTYFYDGNQLRRIQENGSLTLGFKGVAPTNTANQYTYDIDGNLLTDSNKSITGITYNDFNLPKRITFTGGRYIDNIYDATGRKIKKTYFDGTTSSTTEYVGGVVYLKAGTAAAVFQNIPTSEGYVYRDGNGVYRYTYQLTDHLGNIRLSFTDSNGDRLITSNEIIEEFNYDPFGLKHEGYNSISLSIGNSIAQKIEYNSREFEEAAGYNMNEMDWRHYDPAIARWVCVDPVIHVSTSPYSAFENNPVLFNDPSGMSVYSGLIGAFLRSVNKGDIFASYFGSGTDKDSVQQFELMTTEDVIELLLASMTMESDDERRGRLFGDPPGGKLTGDEDGGEQEDPPIRSFLKTGTKVLGKKTTFLGRLWATLEEREYEYGGMTYNVDADGQITGFRPLGGLGVLGFVSGGSSLKLLSLVKNDSKLLKLAQETFAGNKSLSKEANALMEQLGKGNLNPGSGTKNIIKNIFEARSKGGARVYFRTVGGKVEILGYSSKGNQQEVIDRIINVYL